MFNLQTFFQAVDKQKRNPHLAAVSPQFANQAVSAFDAPLGDNPPPAAGNAPQITPDFGNPTYQGSATLHPQQISTADALALQVPQMNGQQQMPAEQQMNPAMNPASAGTIAPVLTPSQATASQIQAIQGKDYSIKKDDDGNVTHRGADRNKKWSTLEKVGSTLLGGLIGYSKGGLGGAIAGAISGGTNRNFQAQQSDRRMLGQLKPQMAEQQKTEEFDTAQNYKKATTANIYADNEQKVAEFNQKKIDNEAERARKVDDRLSRERTSRMTQVSGILKSLPAYDPANPKFAELTKALGDVDLPITAKDSKKKIDLKQDQRTGQWTTIVTDPVTGTQETRDVIKDGKPFASTPTVVMQGELGINRQERAQEFTAGENDKNRSLRREQFLKSFSYKVEQDAKNGTFKKIDQLRQLEKDKAAGEIDADTYNQMKAVIERF